MVRIFPDGFLWGTAISSFQAEMGAGEPSDGTDWWAWVHDEDNISVGRVSGDTPCKGLGKDNIGVLVYTQSLLRMRKNVAERPS